MFDSRVFKLPGVPIFSLFTPFLNLEMFQNKLNTVLRIILGSHGITVNTSRKKLNDPRDPDTHVILN